MSIQAGSLRRSFSGDMVNVGLPPQPQPSPHLLPLAPPLYPARSVSAGGEVSFVRYLCRGSSPMNIVAFSPADDLLLAAGNDNVVRLCEVVPGAAGGAGAKREFRHHKDAVSACLHACGAPSPRVCCHGWGLAGG